MRHILVCLLMILCLTMAVSTADAGSNVLTWTDNSGNETAFNIERKAEACAGVVAFTPLASTTANVATWIDGTVSEGVTYCYRVNASNAAGVSAWSNTVDRTIPFTIPPAPSQLGVTGGP